MGKHRRKVHSQPDPDIREVKIILTVVCIIGLFWFVALPTLGQQAQPLKFLDGIIPLAYAEEQRIWMIPSSLSPAHSGTGSTCPTITGPASATDTGGITITHFRTSSADGCRLNAWVIDRTTTPQKLLPEFYNEKMTGFEMLHSQTSTSFFSQSCRFYSVSGEGIDPRLNITAAYEAIDGRVDNISGSFGQCDGGISKTEFRAGNIVDYTNSMALNNTFFSFGVNLIGDDRAAAIDNTVSANAFLGFEFTNPTMLNNTVWMMQEHPKFQSGDITGGFFGIDDTTFTFDSNTLDDTEIGQVLVFKEFNKTETGTGDIRVAGGYQAQTAAGDMWIRVEVKDGSYGTQQLDTFPPNEHEAYQGGGSLGVFHIEPADLAITPFDFAFTPNWSNSTEQTYTIMVGIDDNSTAGSVLANITSIEIESAISYDFEDINTLEYYETNPVQTPVGALAPMRTSFNDYDAGILNITSLPQALDEWQYADWRTTTPVTPYSSGINIAGGPSSLGGNVPTNAVEIDQSGAAGDSGSTLFFKTLKKSDYIGQNFTIYWNGTDTGATGESDVYFQLRDGSYDRNDSNDFDDGVALPTKGGGILGNTGLLNVGSDLTPTIVSHEIDPDWGSSTLEQVTLMVLLTDNIGTQHGTIQINNITATGGDQWIAGTSDVYNIQAQDFCRLPDTSVRGECSTYEFANFPSLTTTTLPTPSAPTGLTLQTLGFEAVKLDWDHDLLNVTNFKISRESPIGGGFTVINQSAGIDTTFLDTNSTLSLLPSTQYNYEVCALNGGSESTCITSAITTPARADVWNVKEHDAETVNLVIGGADFDITTDGGTGDWLSLTSSVASRAGNSANLFKSFDVSASGIKDSDSEIEIYWDHNAGLAGGGDTFDLQLCATNNPITSYNDTEWTPEARIACDNPVEISVSYLGSTGSLFANEPIFSRFALDWSDVTEDFLTVLIGFDDDIHTRQYDLDIKNFTWTNNTSWDFTGLTVNYTNTNELPPTSTADFECNAARTDKTFSSAEDCDAGAFIATSTPHSEFVAAGYNVTQDWQYREYKDLGSSTHVPFITASIDATGFKMTSSQAPTNNEPEERGEMWLFKEFPASTVLGNNVTIGWDGVVNVETGGITTAARIFNGTLDRWNGTQFEVRSELITLNEHIQTLSLHTQTIPFDVISTEQVTATQSEPTVTVAIQLGDTSEADDGTLTIHNVTVGGEFFDFEGGTITEEVSGRNGGDRGFISPSTFTAPAAPTDPVTNFALSHDNIDEELDLSWDAVVNADEYIVQRLSTERQVLEADSFGTESNFLSTITTTNDAKADDSGFDEGDIPTATQLYTGFGDSLNTGTTGLVRYGYWLNVVAGGANQEAPDAEGEVEHYGAHVSAGTRPSGNNQDCKPTTSPIEQLGYSPVQDGSGNWFDGACKVNQIYLGSQSLNLTAAQVADAEPLGVNVDNFTGVMAAAKFFAGGGSGYRYQDSTGLWQTDSSNGLQIRSWTMNQTWVNVTTTALTTYSDPVFQHNTYYYRVIPTSTAGDGPAGNILNGTLSIPPLRVPDLNATDNGSTVDLEWFASPIKTSRSNSEDPVQGYIVQRSTGGNETVFYDGIGDAGGNNHDVEEYFLDHTGLTLITNPKDSSDRTHAGQQLNVTSAINVTRMVVKLGCNGGCGDFNVEPDFRGSIYFENGTLITRSITPRVHMGADVGGATGDKGFVQFIFAPPVELEPAEYIFGWQNLGKSCNSADCGTTVNRSFKVFFENTTGTANDSAGWAIGEDVLGGLAFTSNPLNGTMDYDMAMAIFAESTWETIGTTTADDLNFTDSSPPQSVTKAYRVLPYNDAGIGDVPVLLHNPQNTTIIQKGGSFDYFPEDAQGRPRLGAINVGEMVTFEFVAIPEPITDLTATAVPSSIFLNWTIPAGTIDSIVLERSDQSDDFINGANGTSFYWREPYQDGTNRIIDNTDEGAYGQKFTATQDLNVTRLGFDMSTQASCTSSVGTLRGIITNGTGDVVHRASNNTRDQCFGGSSTSAPIFNFFFDPPFQIESGTEYVIGINKTGTGGHATGNDMVTQDHAGTLDGIMVEDLDIVGGLSWDDFANDGPFTLFAENYTHLITLGSTATNYTDSTGDDGVNYFYRAYACNISGCSEFGNFAREQEPILTITDQFNSTSDRWEYREQDISGGQAPVESFDPQAKFVSTDAPDGLQINTGENLGTGGNLADVGHHYIFKIFNKTDIDGSDISVNWKGNHTVGSADRDPFIRVHDGAYLGLDNHAFPYWDYNTHTNAPRLQEYGAGLLGEIQGSTGQPFDETLTLDSFDIDYAGSTEDFVTVMIGQPDLSAEHSYNLFIRSIDVSLVGNWTFNNATSPVSTTNLRGPLEDFGTREITKEDTGFFAGAEFVEAPEIPGRITDLTATQIPTSIFLNWTAPTGPITGYKIERSLGNETEIGQGDKDYIHTNFARPMTFTFNRPLIAFGESLTLQHDIDLTGFAVWPVRDVGTCTTTVAGNVTGHVWDATDDSIIANSTTILGDMCTMGTFSSATSALFEFDPPVELSGGSDYVFGIMKNGTHSGGGHDWEIPLIGTGGSWDETYPIPTAGYVSSSTEPPTFGAPHASQDIRINIHYLGHETLVADTGNTNTNYTDSTCPQGISCNYVVRALNGITEAEISNKADEIDEITDFSDPFFNQTSSIWQYRTVQTFGNQPGIWNFTLGSSGAAFNTTLGDSFIKMGTPDCGSSATACLFNPATAAIPKEKEYTGEGWIFKTFNRTSLENATLTIDLHESTGGGANAPRVEIIDGPLHRDNFNAFPDQYDIVGGAHNDVDQTAIGNGTLLFDTSIPLNVNGEVSIDLSTADWQDATSDSATLVIQIRDNHLGQIYGLLVRSVFIDTIGEWDFTNSTVTPTTGALSASGAIPPSNIGWNSTQNNENDAWGTGLLDRGYFTAGGGTVSGEGFSPAILPPAPAVVNATADLANVIVNWTAVTSTPEVDKYWVERGIIVNSTWQFREFHASGNPVIDARCNAISGGSGSEGHIRWGSIDSGAAISTCDMWKIFPRDFLNNTRIQYEYEFDHVSSSSGIGGSVFVSTLQDPTEFERFDDNDWAANGFARNWFSGADITDLIDSQTAVVGGGILIDDAVDNQADWDEQDTDHAVIVFRVGDGSILTQSPFFDIHWINITDFTTGDQKAFYNFSNPTIVEERSPAAGHNCDDAGAGVPETCMYGRADSGSLEVDDFEVIANVTAPTITYNDTSVDLGTNYQYRVFAENSLGNGTSTESNIVLTNDIPAVVQNVETEGIFGPQINIQWDALPFNSGEGDPSTGLNLTKYQLFRQNVTAGDPFTLLTELFATSPPPNFYNDTAVSTGHSFSYIVSACNILGCNENSTAATFNFPDVPQMINFTAIANATDVTVDWATDPNATDYFVFRNGSQIANPTASIFQDPSVALDTLFNYSAFARGISGNSTEVFQLVTTNDLPTAPLNLTGAMGIVIPDLEDVFLDWEEENDNGTGSPSTGVPILNYTIERKQGLGAFGFLANVTGGIFEYEDETVISAANYTYQVQGCNAVGCSPFSNTFSLITTPLMPPDAPTNLTATTLSGTEIKLDWLAAVAGDPPTDYVLQQRHVGFGGFVTIATIPAPTLTFTDTALLVGNTYDYQVRADNGAGSSAYSNIAQNVTFSIPTVPLNLVATAISETEISLDWDVPAQTNGDITAYDLEIESPIGGGFSSLVQLIGNVTDADFFDDFSSYPDNATADLVWEEACTGGVICGVNATADNLLYDQPLGSFNRGPTYDILTNLGFNLTNATGGGPNSNFTLLYEFSMCEENESTCSFSTSGSSRIGVMVTSADKDVGGNNIQDAVGITHIERRGTATNGLFGILSDNQAMISPAGAIGGMDSDDNRGTRFFYNVTHTFNGTESITTFTADTCESRTSCPRGNGNFTLTQAGERYSDLRYIKVTPDAAGSVIMKWTLDNLILVINGTSFDLTEPLTEYTATGLTTKTEYNFRANATNAQGTSPYSNEDDATTFGVAGPPINLGFVTNGVSEITVDWDEPTNDFGSAVTGYSIDQAQDVGGTFINAINDTGNNTEPLEETFIGLLQSTNYIYRIAAWNGFGLGVYSANLTAGTFTGPSAPENFFAQFNATKPYSVFLSWETPLSDGGKPILGYLVERKDTGGVFQQIANLTSPTLLNYTDTGLLNLALHEYRVAAYTNPTGDFASDSAATFVPANIVNFTITDFNVVGDILKQNYSFVVDDCFPDCTLTQADIERNGIVEANWVLSEAVPLDTEINFTTYFIIPTSGSQSINTTAIVTNLGGQGDDEAGVVTTQLQFVTDVLFFNHTRINSFEDVQFNLTRKPIPWDVSCETRENSFVVKESFSESGVGYVSRILDATPSLNLYVSCEDPIGTQILAFTSFGQGNGTLALTAFTNQLGDFMGVPIPYIFIIILAAIWTGRSAPTGIIVLAVAIGSMGVLGYFDPITGSPVEGSLAFFWGFIVFLTLLGVFIGKRFF